MAHGNFVLDKGYRAGSAPITKYRAVKFSAAETVVPVTGIADQIAGFAQYSVSASEQTKGKGCSTRVMGVTEAEATGPIAVGAQVQMETDGRVSALVAASGKRVVGRCVGHAATNAGDRIALNLTIQGSVA